MSDHLHDVPVPRVLLALVAIAAAALLQASSASRASAQSGDGGPDSQDQCIDEPLLPELDGCPLDVPPGDVVFFDDFNGPAGEAPDSTKWAVRNEVASWGVGCFRPNQVKKDGAGNLKFTAVADSGCSGRYKYSSGAMTTGSDGSLFKTKYGLFEFRAKIACGNGTWDALWMSGATPGAEWPLDGEIDVFEHMTSSSFGTINEGRLQSTLHGPTTQTSGHWQEGVGRTELYRLCDAFHTYAVDWRPGSITFLYDGQSLGTLRPPDVSGYWPFDTHAERIIVSLQLGAWGGALAPADWTPMLLDYVRVTKGPEHQ